MAQTAANEMPAASGRGRLVTLWILQGLAALAFLSAGGSKLGGGEEMVAVFDKIGVGQWFRYVTGLLEVVGAIGLLIPRYAFYAAALLAIIMIGAVITHVAILGGSPLPAIFLLILTGAIAYLRKP